MYQVFFFQETEFTMTEQLSMDDETHLRRPNLSKQQTFDDADLSEERRSLFYNIYDQAGENPFKTYRELKERQVTFTLINLIYSKPELTEDFMYLRKRFYIIA